MTSLTKTSAAAAWVALAIAATGPAAAQAPSANDGWRFQAAIYGWFPAISGTTSFPVQTAAGRTSTSAWAM